MWQARFGMERSPAQATPERWKHQPKGIPPAGLQAAMPTGRVESPCMAFSPGRRSHWAGHCRQQFLFFHLLLRHYCLRYYFLRVLPLATAPAAPSCHWIREAGRGDLRICAAGSSDRAVERNRVWAARLGDRAFGYRTEALGERACPHQPGLRRGRTGWTHCGLRSTGVAGHLCQPDSGPPACCA